jgi:A/G-specific adenine glycosylase
VRGLRRGLLRWYRTHHRKLPWRPTPGQRPDPYHTLVSEAMLQQTQVATVIPYFERFIAAFPTLADLADADEQAVLTRWQGLGYYRRARNLHAAARLCVKEHDGRVPASLDALLDLPGVGRYTAGAVASIAFGRRAPILDGNVARVLARWVALDQPIDQPAIRRRLWSLAQTLVPPRNPGDFNQAMMELGATLCTPREPRCMACPVRQHCRAFAEGRTAELPITTPRKAPQTVTHRVLAIRRGRRFLFEQRPDHGLWSAMWQCPTLEKPENPSLAAWAHQRFGLTITEPQTLDAFTHQTTHRTIRFLVHRAQVTAGRLRPGAGQWRHLHDLDDLPLPNPQRQVVTLLQQH